MAKNKRKQRGTSTFADFRRTSKRSDVAVVVHQRPGRPDRPQFHLRADLGSMVQSDLSWTERLSFEDADALCDTLARAFDYDVEHKAPGGRVYGYFASANIFKLTLHAPGAKGHMRRLMLTLSRRHARQLLLWLAPRVDWELEK